MAGVSQASKEACDEGPDIGKEDLPQLQDRAQKAGRACDLP